jgi:CubicO group peptidase (beta-lactamase class C family)
MTEINHLSLSLWSRLSEVVKARLGELMPACVICAIHRDQMILNHAWGWIDPGTEQVPTHTDTLFDLASLTKLFTTSAFLAQVGVGSVGLHDPVVTVIPEFAEGGLRPTDGGIDPHSKQPLPMVEGMQGKLIDPTRVTFWHVLTHTSGLAAWRNVYNVAGDAPLPPDQTDPISRAERWRRGLDMIVHSPFVSEPGDQVRYSDLGLMLLGESLARLMRKSLDEAIYDSVTKPLSLTNIKFRPSDWGYKRDRIAPTENDPSWRNRRVWGEVHDENACSVGGVAGHAGLFGTAWDVAQLGKAWLNRDSRLNINIELMDEAVREQARTDNERRGLGWMIKSPVGSSASDKFSVDSFGHTGFTGTSLWIDPEKRLVVACLTNSVYPGRKKMNALEFRRTVNGLLAEA